MNVRNLVAGVLSGFCLFAGSAHSALVDGGDFSTDTASGLDWLKLDKLNGYSYAQVAAGALGYTTAGWRFATLQEVTTLFAINIGPENGLYNGNFGFPNASSPSYFSGAEDLVVKLGINLGFSDDRAVYNITQYPDLHQISVQGYFSDAGSRGLAEATAVFTGENYTEPFGRWLVIPAAGAYSAYEQGPNKSSFLVRQSTMAAEVPEPSTALLLGVGLFGLAMRRRRQTAP